MMEIDEGLSRTIIVIDKATFLVSRRSTGTISGYGDPRSLSLCLKLNMNVLCAVSTRRAFDLLFFVEKNFTVRMYQEMLQNWLMSQLSVEEDSIFQQDDVSPGTWMYMSRRRRVPGNYSLQTICNCYCL